MQKQKIYGSVSQAKDGRWSTRVTKSSVKFDKQGKFRTKEEAERYQLELNLELQNILSSANPDKVTATVTTYIRDNFLPYKARTVKSSTLSRNKSIAETHVIPANGKKKLSNLKHGDIQKHIDKLKEDGFSHSTVKKVYDFYNCLYSHAVKFGDIQAENNPMVKVAMYPKKSFPIDEVKEKRKYFTAEELEIFEQEALKINVIGEPVYRYGEVFLFLFNTGLRVGELSALRKRDVHIEEGYIEIIGSVSYDGGTKVLSTTKTANSKRCVPLNEQAKKLAEIILEKFPHGEMFIYTEDGNYTDATQLSKPWRNMLKNAGIPHRGIHSTRHTFVSYLFANGIDIEQIAKIIGDNVGTVQMTYLHITQEMMARSVNLVNITGKPAQGVC